MLDSSIVNETYNNVIPKSSASGHGWEWPCEWIESWVERSNEEREKRVTTEVTSSHIWLLPSSNKHFLDK